MFIICYDLYELMLIYYVKLVDQYFLCILIIIKDLHEDLEVI